MKFFSAIFFLIFLPVGNCFSQVSVNTTFHVNKLTPEGVLLDKDWKFQPGDSSEYAKPDFDDSKWQYINPTLDIHDSLPEIPRSGICWFRLHVSLDSSLMKDQLALLIQQVGASEIYVNGDLIKLFGVVSHDPAKVESFNPALAPIPFRVDNRTSIVFAVRFALQQDAKYTTIRIGKNPAFQLKVNNWEIVTQQYVRESTRLMSSSVFRIGLFVILVVLHLAFFAFYPSQKANLYFSLFALLVLIGDIIEIATLNPVNAPGNINRTYYALIILDALAFVGYFLLVTAFYTLFDEKKRWLYWTLLCTVGAWIFLDTFYHVSWLNILIAICIFNAELVRIAFKSVKNKRRGARIIAAGATLFLIFWIAFILGIPFRYMNIHLTPTFDIGDLTYNLMYISIPVATSIYLGLDFAYTSLSLKQKLEEVQHLSSKTIEQEKEKQQILADQNERLETEVEHRTEALNKSLTELKSTQAQLIQSEKMASLGELTAGIAHEIQNPLNFVNNFSEVNKELIDEMEQEINKGNFNDVKNVAKNIRENEEKIIHHGKKADAIVKSMLQHSRAGAAKKEPTDINALADEYLRLSYHGLRARDKTFNATLKTDFDESIGKIDIVPQDIGRVLLNLINNAFYAVSEKKNEKNDGYEPMVTVSTKKTGDHVLISVKDNGNGIPQKIVDKIFQPFFTTKPTGQGTGLGLSLAYDIVKTHGGEIKVKSKEGEGSEFIIQMPGSA